MPHKDVPYNYSLRCFGLRSTILNRKIRRNMRCESYKCIEGKVLHRIKIDPRVGKIAQLSEQLLCLCGDLSSDARGPCKYPTSMPVQDANMYRHITHTYYILHIHCVLHITHTYYTCILYILHMHTRKNMNLHFPNGSYYGHNRSQKYFSNSCKSHCYYPLT